MSHQCTYCGAELEYHDSYGFLAAHQSGEKLGEIYLCPNREGFETPDEARSFDPRHPRDADWQEIRCDSSEHHVSGSFYTDSAGNLHEGYPC